MRVLRLDAARYDSAHDHALDKAEGKPLRLERWALEREQAAREREATPADLKVAALQTELTQLKSKLAAQGVRPI